MAPKSKAWDKTYLTRMNHVKVDLLMDQTPGEKGPRFAIFVIRQYRRWGYFVAEHDWKFILLCLIITLFGLIKVFLTPYVLYL